MNPPHPASDWSVFRDSLARDICQVARLYQTLMMRLLSEDGGHRRLRLSFGPLIMALPPAGLRVTELAGRLQMSKQNCVQLLGQLEAADYIERLADPADRRGRIVRLTPHGLRLISDGLAVAGRVDDRCRELTGDAGFADLAASLRQLRRGLQVRPEAAVAHRRDSGLEPSTVSFDLIALAEHCTGKLMALTAARGHAGLRPSHTQVLLHIGSEGGQMQAIARANDVSKQAIGQLVAELETLGYIRRAANPRDGRSKLLLVTAAGAGLADDLGAAAQQFEQRCATVIGATALARLRYGLQRLDRGLSAGPVGGQPRAAAQPTSAVTSNSTGGDCLDLALYLLWRLQSACRMAPERRLLRGAPDHLALNRRGLALAAARTVDAPALERQLESRLGKRRLVELNTLIGELRHEHNE